MGRKNKTLTVLLVALFLLPIIAVQQTTVKAQQKSQTTDNWDMFRGGPSHIGVAAGPSVSSSPNVIWRFPSSFQDMGFGFISAPAIVDGVVYTGSWNTYVYAINTSTGNQVWRSPTDWWVQTSPAVAYGMVYVASSHGGFYALNATTGERVWSWGLVQDPHFSIYSSPTVVDGVVYIGSSGGDLFAFNAFNGNQIWDIKLAGSVEASPAIVGGVVYVSSFGGLTVPFDSGRVYSLNAANGAIQWSDSFSEPISSSPAVGNGIVYVGCRDNLVYALAAASGFQLWNFSTYNEVNSSPALQNGIVYVASDDGTLYSLNASSGEKIWSYDVGKPASNPVIADRLVYSVSSDGSFYALNIANGEKVWRYSLNETGVLSDPVTAGGVIYLNSQDGVYALGSEANVIAPSPTPTIPETSLLAVIPLLIAVFPVAVILRHRKKPQTTFEVNGC